MNIQIFGTKKCNDTKKAERFFKERGIKYQFIDMKEKGMSKGEFNSVAQVNGGLENMVNWDGKDKDLLALIKYIADEGARSPVDFGSAPTEAERRQATYEEIKKYVAEYNDGMKVSDSCRVESGIICMECKKR